MDIKILKLYINTCEEIGVEPTFEGLKQFNNNNKKLLAS